MESTFLPETADPQVAEPEAPAAEPSFTVPAVPALIFLESAEDAGVCGVDGVCD